MAKKTIREDTKLLLDDEYRFNDNILNQSRIIFLYGEIDEKSSEEINKKLITMHIIDNKKPIIIEINSGGGCCTSGLAIIDTMKVIRNPIYTNIVGRACSMATYIAMAGDKRFMTKNSYWMAHPMSTWKADYINFVKDSLKWLNRLDKRLDGIYKKYTKLNKADFDKFHTGELWFDAKECKKKGIIDKII